MPDTKTNKGKQEQKCNSKEENNPSDLQAKGNFVPMKKLIKINFQSRVSIAENEKNKTKQKPTKKMQALLVQMDCLLQQQPVVSRKVCGLDSVDKPFYLAIKSMLLLQYCTVSCDMCNDFSVQEDCSGDT